MENMLDYLEDRYPDLVSILGVTKFLKLNLDKAIEEDEYEDIVLFSGLIYLNCIEVIQKAQKESLSQKRGKILTGAILKILNETTMACGEIKMEISNPVGRREIAHKISSYLNIPDVKPYLWTSANFNITDINFGAPETRSTHPVLNTLIKDLALGHPIQLVPDIATFKAMSANKRLDITPNTLISPVRGKGKDVFGVKYKAKDKLYHYKGNLILSPKCKSKYISEISENIIADLKRKRLKSNIKQRVIDGAEFNITGKYISTAPIAISIPAQMAMLWGGSKTHDILNGKIGDIHNGIIKDRNIIDPINSKLRIPQLFLSTDINPIILIDHYFKLAYKDTIPERLYISLYRINVTGFIDRLVDLAKLGVEIYIYIEMMASNEYIRNITFMIDALKNIPAHKLKIVNCHHLKVHAKNMLFTYSNGRWLLMSGTGNYNESTFSKYKDVHYITDDNDSCADALMEFQGMFNETITCDSKYMLMSNHLLASNNLPLRATGGHPSPIYKLITTILNSGSMCNGKIKIKCNHIDSDNITKALMMAKDRGTVVELLVRTTKLYNTDYLKTKTLTGRYLEHERVYIFEDYDGESRVFISSADLCEDKLYDRVESFVEIKDEKSKLQLINRFDKDYEMAVEC